MNELLSIKNPAYSSRCHPTIKIDTSSVRNSNHLRNRLKLDANLTFKDPQPQDYMCDLETYRKLDLSADNQYQITHVPSNKATNHDSFTTQNFSDSEQVSFDSRLGSMKSKELAKLPGIQKPKVNPNKVQPKLQGCTGNSSLSTNHESDRGNISKPVETSHVKEIGRRIIIGAARNPSTCKASNTNETTPTVKERRGTPDVKNRPRIRPISVEKREALRAFALREEVAEPKKEKEDELKDEVIGLRESYKTLTSAFNSNQTLGDLPIHDAMEGEDPEKIIKEVVEKHVEEAYRNIRLIKRNFQRRSKTYLFYIYKES